MLGRTEKTILLLDTVAVAEGPSNGEEGLVECGTPGQNRSSTNTSENRFKTISLKLSRKKKGRLVLRLGFI